MDVYSFVQPYSGCLVYSQHSATIIGLHMRMTHGSFSSTCYFSGECDVVPSVCSPLMDITRICESLHTAFCLHFIYWYFVIHFGDVSGGLGSVVWYVVYFHVIIRIADGHIGAYV